MDCTYLSLRSLSWLSKVFNCAFRISMSPSICVMSFCMPSMLFWRSSMAVFSTKRFSRRFFTSAWLAFRACSCTRICCWICVRCFSSPLMEGVEIACLPVCLTGVLVFFLAVVAFLVCAEGLFVVVVRVAVRVVFLLWAGTESASTHKEIISISLFIYILNNLPKTSLASTFLYLLETVVFVSHFSVVFTSFILMFTSTFFSLLDDVVVNFTF